MPSTLGVEWCTYKGHFPLLSGSLFLMAGNLHCTGTLSLSNPIYRMWFGCISCCSGGRTVVKSEHRLMVKSLMELCLAQCTCWCNCCCQRSDRWGGILSRTLALFLACLHLTASLTACHHWCRYMFFLSIRGMSRRRLYRIFVVEQEGLSSTYLN